MARCGWLVRTLSWRSGSVMRWIRGAHVDANSFQTLDRLQVAFEADAALPVDELHVLDQGARVPNHAGVRRRVHRGLSMPISAATSPHPTAHAFWRSERRWG